MIFKTGNNKLFLIARNFLIYFFIIFFSAFSAVPIKFFSNVSVFPNIPSILIFIFLIIKQENINYFAIFIFGLLFDIFNNLPIGITSITWLISSKFINFLRLHLYTPDNFIVTFRDFSIYAILNILIQWIIFSLLYRTAYPFCNFLIQFVLNLIFFAIFYHIFKKTERFFI